MNPKESPDEFYKKLKVQLLDTSIWPAPYLFKFIVPTAVEKIQQIEDLFNHSGAVITKKESSTGKYTSISVNVRLKNPDAVIAKYKEVSVVEGVISL